MNTQQVIETATILIEQRETLSMNKNKAIALAAAHIKKHADIDIERLLTLVAQPEIEDQNGNIYVQDPEWMTNQEIANRLKISREIINKTLVKMGVVKQNPGQNAYLINDKNPHPLVKEKLYLKPGNKTPYMRVHFHSDFLDEIENFMKQKKQMALV